MVDSVFYPDALTVAEQTYVRYHKVWPVLLALHHEIKVQVCLHEQFSSDQRFQLCDKHGMPYMYVECGNIDGDSIKVVRYETFDSRLTKPPLIESANIRYILTKIRKMYAEGSPDRHYLENNPSASFIKDAMRSAVSKLMERQPSEARKQYSPGFSSKTDKVLLDIVRGRIKVDDINTLDRDIQDNLARCMHDALLHETSFARAREGVIEALSGDKFVFRLRPCEKVSRTYIQSFTMLGVRINNVSELVDGSYKSQPTFVDLSVTYPIRFYRNLESLHDDVRDNIMATLTLNSMSRTSPHQPTNDRALFPFLLSNHYMSTFNSETAFSWAQGLTGYDAYHMITDKRNLF